MGLERFRLRSLYDKQNEQPSNEKLKELIRKTKKDATQKEKGRRPRNTKQ